jgi:hypothetical protein
MVTILVWVAFYFVPSSRWRSAPPAFAMRLDYGGTPHVGGCYAVSEGYTLLGDDNSWAGYAERPCQKSHLAEVFALPAAASGQEAPQPVIAKRRCGLAP